MCSGGDVGAENRGGNRVAVQTGTSPNSNGDPAEKNIWRQGAQEARHTVTTHRSAPRNSQVDMADADGAPAAGAGREKRERKQAEIYVPPVADKTIEIKKVRRAELVGWR